MRTRHLAPQFLVAVGAVVVAVDRVQPVAAAVSPNGAVLDVVSWSELIRPPAAMAWPNRRIAVEGDPPFDELGNLADLAFWNIIFDDEDFDLLAEGPVDDQGRVLV